MYELYDISCHSIFYSSEKLLSICKNWRCLVLGISLTIKTIHNLSNENNIINKLQTNRTMIAPMDARVYTSAPMEKLSPILTDEHSKASTDTNINKTGIKGFKHSSEYTAPTCNSIACYDTEKHTKIKENKAESNTSISPLVPVGSSIGLRRLKRKLFLQRVSASKTTQGTSTSSSISCGYDSTRTRTTSTRTSASSIGDEELRKMLTERLFRGSISHN